jgi:hypothetical protein
MLSAGRLTKSTDKLSHGNQSQLSPRIRGCDLGLIITAELFLVMGLSSMNLSTVLYGIAYYAMTS